MSTKMPARSPHIPARRPWLSTGRPGRSSCRPPTLRSYLRPRRTAGLHARSRKARSRCLLYPDKVNQNILVIEDDLDMANVLQQGLEQENYSVTIAHNGWKGLELAQRGQFEAILLDVMLPALDGYALVRQLRSGGIRTPVLMVTARDSVADIVLGLDAGAEDYLTKPFSFLELLARLRALTRRRKPQP